MSLISSFSNLDKRFAWSFLGFVLAAIFGGLTIYVEFFKDNSPSLVVEVMSDTKILDLKEDVSDLKIIYGDVDIKSLNQTLSVIVLKIKNTGGSSILNGFYDETYPLLIRLNEGKLLKVEKISASNEYLISSATPIKSDEKTIGLPKVIMEKGESYTVKVLVLHSDKAEVILKPSGKVAGVKEIALVKSTANNDELSYWGKVFQGDILVQLGRPIPYMFGFMFSLIAIFLPIIFLSDAIQKRTRKKIVRQFKAHSGGNFNDNQKRIFETYIDDGLHYLKEARDIINNTEKLDSYLKKRRYVVWCG